MSKSFQEASQEYLLARQRMNEKVNECKEIEAKMTQILHQIQDAYAARGDQAKTVGALSVTIEGAEGELPEGTLIKVSVEPEFVPDFEELSEEAEKKNQLAWADKEAFPSTFKFDTIQQREAIVHVTIVKDGEDEEPLKTFSFPIAKLFNANLDSWFNIATGEEEPVKPAEVVKAEEAPKEEAAAPSTTETIFGINAPKTEGETKPEGEEKAAEDKESEAFHDAVQPEEAKEEAKEDNKEEAKEDVKEDAEEEVKEEAKEDAKAEETTEEPKSDDAAADEVAEESTAEKDEAAEPTEVAEAAPAFTGRVHVKASFEMSAIEALAQQAVALSKAKSDMDVEIRLCDQELSSARIRYERLKASQKPVTASSGVAGGLLAGMKGKTAYNRAPAKPQTFYERTTAAFSSTFTPQRRQLAWSFAFFVVVSAVFHTNGDDLLI